MSLSKKSTAMRKSAIFLLIVLIASACGARTSEMSSQTTDWAFPASKVKSITVDNQAGDILVRQTTGSDILITATKSARSADDLGGVNVEFQEVGDSISGTVEYLPGSQGVSVDFELQLPLGLSLQITSSSGNIMIENYQGALSVSTASGALTLHNVRGEIQANTSSGNIDARDVDGNVDISSASGNILVAYSAALQRMNNPVALADVLEMWTYNLASDGAQNVSSPQLPGNGQRIFESSSGAITLQLTPDLQVDIFAQLFSGNFKSEFDQLQVSSDNVRHIGHINGGGPLIILTNAGGDIRIEELSVP